MLGELYLAFLGTSAGEGPTASRGAPCMLLHLGKEMWMVDCGDGAYRQLQTFRALHHPRAVLPGTSTEVDFRVPITRIFITHLHPGHVAGLPLMLLRLLGDAVAAEDERDFNDNPSPPGQTTAGVHSPHSRAPHVTLVGPAGLRRFLRSTLSALRLAHPRGRFAVHELLLDDDARTPCGPTHLLLPSEAPGLDVQCDRSGLWREFDVGAGGEIVISAGPVLHTVPSIGYVFTERSHGVPRARVFDPDDPSDSLTISHSSSSEADDENSLGPGVAPPPRVRRVSFSLPPGHESERDMESPRERERDRDPREIFPGRKIVVLGDTCDASSLSRIAMDATLLVHEATDTHLPHESSGAVRERVVGRGHATAQMAGAFAKSIRARHLVLNHFCARFPAPSAPNDPKALAMQALAAQASAQWGTRDPGALVIATKDFDIVAAPPETSTYAQAKELHPARPTHHQRASSAGQKLYGTMPEPQPYPGQQAPPTINRRPSISSQRGPSPPSAGPTQQSYDLIPYTPAQAPPSAMNRPTSMSGQRGPSPPSAGHSQQTYDQMSYAPAPPQPLNRRPSMSGQRGPPPPSAGPPQQPYEVQPYTPAPAPPPTIHRRSSMSGQRGPPLPSAGAPQPQQLFESAPYAPTPAPPPTINRRPSMSGQRVSGIVPPSAYLDPAQDFRQTHQRAHSQQYNFTIPANGMPPQQPQPQPQPQQKQQRPSPPTATTMYPGHERRSSYAGGGQAPQVPYPPPPQAQRGSHPPGAAYANGDQQPPGARADRKRWTFRLVRSTV